MADGIGRQPPVLLLGDMQHRDERGARLGIQRDQIAGALLVLRRQTRHYRSTPPMIGSMELMMATASATKAPRIMTGRHWRLAKEGSRMCIRYGFPGAAPTREQPNSPRGDSTGA